MLWRTIIGALVGAAAGALLYRFVGCRTGACPLTSNLYLAMVLWGLIGAFVGAGNFGK
ncbi:MAG: hypothetical protein ABR497_07555 [Kiritimatiellia bacterium]